MVSVSNQRAPFYWGCTAEVAGENQKMRCCQKKAWQWPFETVVRGT